MWMERDDTDLIFGEVQATKSSNIDDTDLPF
jgi:hypothetical protein